jgi:hypothetical protein
MKTFPKTIRKAFGLVLPLNDVKRRAFVDALDKCGGNYLLAFRATGTTAHLKNNGTLEAAQHIANRESPRTTKLYNRRRDEISLDG